MELWDGARKVATFEPHGKSPPALTGELRLGEKACRAGWRIPAHLSGRFFVDSVGLDEQLSGLERVRRRTKAGSPPIWETASV